MSVSSNSRKESTESYAAQQMHNTMGIAPELAQLNDKNLDNDLPSRVASSSDTDVPGDIESASTLAATEGSGLSDAEAGAEIEESKRASWGQPPISPDADDAAVDEDTPMTAYQRSTDETETSTSGKVADADWNRSTEEGQIPATKVNEPDRTLGNS